MSDRQEIEASPLMLVACIRDCLNRLLAQDSWELPHVDKGRAALDALATSLAESAAREKTLREAVSAFLSKTADWTDDSVHSGLGPLRVALAAVPSPAAERELFKDVPRVPMCTVVTQSSWHAPVRCAYALNHPGEHSWATIPAFPPAADGEGAEA